ncbi:MAG: DUF2268 domain-containing putative Zn-dependent protease [bacterium]
MRYRHCLAVLLLVLATGCGSSDVPTGSVATTTPTGSDDPASAQIITSDIAHFWAAYDAGGKTGSASAFQGQYLNGASAGLKDFIVLRGVTGQSLAQMVAAYPRYFASIRASNLALATDGVTVARIRANFGIIKTLYPASVFPPVTLLVGRFSTGGTTSSNGMLVGSEFYSITANTPLDELQQFQHDNVHLIDSLPIIVAHEHAHILQARARGVFTHSNKTLLEQTLMEGGADFIGERSSGGNINGRLAVFGVSNEAALWADFRTAMRGTDVSRWLYNQGTAGATADRPGDLGYFIGYRIVAAYYARQSDKVAALRDIIEIKDADDFLARSGYAP